MSKPTKQELITAMEKELQVNVQLAKPVLERNLFKFNRYVLKVEEGKDNVPLAPVHLELSGFIDKNKKRKKLVLIPRGHLKSTVVTVGRTLQALVADPTKRILIANATYNLACSFLREVKRHLKFNQQIHMFWGDLSVNPQNWSNDSITLATSVKKEPNVTAMGIGSNMTSQHYDLIILDDLVNADFVNTQDQIQKTVDFYKECLNLLEPGGEVIVIGTRWHDSDLYGWIMDNDNNVLSDFDIFIKRAYEGDLNHDDGFKALFPGKFTRKHLKKLYDQQGPYFFATQYLNDPIPQEDADFKSTWFKYYDPTELRGRLMNKFITIDPAISTDKHADYTAIVTVGVDQFNYIYVLDIVRERLQPSQIIDTIFDKWRFFQPVDIGIEDVAFQKTLQYSLTEEMNKRNIYIPIKPLRPGHQRSKENRIKGLQPLYANGRIFHGKNVNYNSHLEDELVRFPRGKHDDIIDALAYMLDIIYPPKRHKVSRENKHRYLYA